jgi:hypothetical protein
MTGFFFDCPTQSGNLRKKNAEVEVVSSLGERSIVLHPASLQ